MPRPTSSGSTRNSRTRKKSAKKVSLSLFKSFIAWEMLVKKMEKLNLSEAEQELIKQDILHKEAELNRKMRKKITLKDFEPLSIIGRGAFGEVRICKFKETGEIVAMKKMKKSEMLYKNQVGHVKAEREILIKARNLWVVNLKCSF